MPNEVDELGVRSDAENMTYAVVIQHLIFGGYVSADLVALE